VSTDAKQVLENSYFDISFTVQNGQGANFRRPNFKNFKVISGPNKAMKMTIINGVRQQQESFGFTLLPLKVGKLTIGPAEVTINGKVFRTKPVQVEVLKASKSQLQSGEEVFVRLIPSDTTAVIGQKILIYYKLFTRKDVSNFGLIAEPEYEGFFAQEERNTDYRTMQEVVNGQTYTTKVMKTVAIYPQKAGKLQIEPLLAEVAIVDGSRRQSFFNRGRRVSISSLPLTILVSPLPEGAPLSFSGAVGDFTMTATPGRTNITTDESVVIKMRITGKGDMKRIQVPAFPIPESFEKYDPVMNDIEQKNFNRSIVVGKEIDYLFVPQQAGTFKVQPEFSFFNPDSMAYETIKTQVFTFNIRQGKNKPKVTLDSDEEQSEQILFPIKKSTHLSSDKSPFIYSKAYTFLLGFPLLALLGGLWFQQKRKEEDNIDDDERKRRAARKKALAQLETAKTYLSTPEKSKSFYDEISKALVGFVCSKLNIPFSALKKSEIIEKLKELNIPSNLIDDFSDVLKNSEMALYAGLNNEAAMQESFQKAERVLTNIEVFLDK
ncbi:MAG TPA: protein BatD, partial [Saprospiraceae bacterium]|nr:protein BatD [Saprospiraceae bacterium]